MVEVTSDWNCRTGVEYGISYDVVGDGVERGKTGFGDALLEWSLEDLGKRSGGEVLDLVGFARSVSVEFGDESLELGLSRGEQNRIEQTIMDLEPLHKFSLV